jgi:hypothetical protein
LKVIKQNIITKRNGTDFYHGSQFIGTTFESVMEYVLDNNNAALVTKWQSIVEKKTPVPA